MNVQALRSKLLILTRNSDKMSEYFRLKIQTVRLNYKKTADTLTFQSKAFYSVR